MTRLSPDEIYLDMVRDVLRKGRTKTNRTGVDAISLFAYEMRFDLRDGTIPLLTTKKMHTRSIFHEIIWYLSGNTNIKYLKDNNVTIWDEWANEQGDLGPVYGKQWRRWTAEKGTMEPDFLPWKQVDQIKNVIDTLRTDPNSRRLLVSAWNVGELDQMALPPCHYSFQLGVTPLNFWERLEHADMSGQERDVPIKELQITLDEMKVPKYELSMILNQRSCDVGLGVPFNIAQYSTLLHMFAQVSNMSVGEFVWRGGDVHIYVNHVDVLKEQLKRKPYKAPKLVLNPYVKEIDDFKYEDFEVVGYESWPALKMDVAV